MLYTDRYRVYKGTRYEYQRLYLTITSASYDFLFWVRQTVQTLLAVRGHFTKQPPRRWGTKTIWKLRFAKKDSLRIFEWMYYDHAVPCLMRKRALAERAVYQISEEIKRALP